jgi:hypothetical protein
VNEGNKIFMPSSSLIDWEMIKYAHDFLFDYFYFFGLLKIKQLKFIEKVY